MVRPSTWKKKQKKSFFLFFMFESVQCGTHEVVGGLVGDVAEQAVDQVLVALQLVLDGLTVDFF